MNISITKNKNWDSNESYFITIITPVYNRRNTIKRTLQSVENQSFRDFEYIIIDDGSTVPSDDLILDYIYETALPVMYIKKQNGGVHTARNIGYEYARGELVVCIDSDDELLPDACQIFHDAWNKIPENKRSLYWQIKALCVDQNGKMCSKLFPENLNEMDVIEAKKYLSLASGEQLGCRRVDIMKNNKFPEPDGVKFVNECVVWLELEKRYLSLGINEVVRVYHTDGDDRICLNNKKSIQSCKNALWNSAYELNHPSTFVMTFRTYCFTVFRYGVMKNLLVKNNKDFIEQFPLAGKKNMIFELLFYFPSVLGAMLYKKTKM